MYSLLRSETQKLIFRTSANMSRDDNIVRASSCQMDKL